MNLKEAFDAAKAADEQVNAVMTKMIAALDEGTDEGKQTALALRADLDAAKAESKTANELYISMRDTSAAEVGEHARKFVPVSEDADPQNGGRKQITRAEYEAMNFADRHSFFKSGGAIVETLEQQSQDIGNQISDIFLFLQGAIVMSNTLTGLIPSAIEALDVVSRELVGMIPAVYRDSSADRAAVGQSITFPVVGARSAVATTPAAYGPTTVDTSAPGTAVTISKSYAVPFYLTGESDKGLGQTIAKATFLRDVIAQSMRTLVNLIEADLVAAGKAGASRAYGTAGSAPFGTAADMTDLAQVGLILDDNGCPTTDRHLVLSNTAVANLRAKQANLINSGADLLRSGIMAMLEGFAVGQSGQLTTHTKGTGSGYLLNLSAGYAAGSTAFTLDTGANTILAGDIITNTKTGRDANKYVASANGTTTSLTINKPGNKVDWVNNDPIAIGNSYTPNLAFHRNAIWLATRAPAIPEGGDAATDATMLVDPVSGLAFELREYRQYRQTAWEVAIAWGAAAVKSEHISILLG